MPFSLCLGARRGKEKTPYLLCALWKAFSVQRPRKEYFAEQRIVLEYVFVCFGDGDQPRLLPQVEAPIHTSHLPNTRSDMFSTSTCFPKYFLAFGQKRTFLGDFYLYKDLTRDLSPMPYVSLVLSKPTRLFPSFLQPTSLPRKHPQV